MFHAAQMLSYIADGREYTWNSQCARDSNQGEIIVVTKAEV